MGLAVPFSAWFRRALAAFVCCALPLALTCSWCVAPGRVAAAVVREPDGPVAEWVRPVPGAVARPFRAPADPYAPGHRGVDFTAVTGTEVHAAGEGTVTFAGDVAGTLHVVVTHDRGLRTSYSFLSSVGVRIGQRVARGQVVGRSGGSGDEHATGVLHFGLRVGERYVDPMLLFRPRDLTALVRLVPADPSPGAPWTTSSGGPGSPDLGLSFAPRPDLAPGTGTALDPGGADDSGGCGDDVPLVGDVVTAVCDGIDWTSNATVDALDEGLELLRSAGRVGEQLAARLEGSLHSLLREVRAAADHVRDALLQTPMGQAMTDLVEIGQRFIEWTQQECSEHAPEADGTGGSGHVLMAVGGIDSSKSTTGPSFGLDTKALGYHDDEVRWFSYAADGSASYDEDDTYGDLDGAAMRLADQLRAFAGENPGREVDLIAHSQGGVVVDQFLTHHYDPTDPGFPPLSTVVTLSSPHEGAPLATAGAELRDTPAGRIALDALDGLRPGPPAGARSVEQLAENSKFMRHLFDGGIPANIRYTTIGGTDDVVVPANRIGVPGATEVVVDVATGNDHTEITHDSRALQVVRSALEQRPPPCTSVLEGIRSAIEPVAVSRVSRDIGEYGSQILRGIG